MIYCFSFLIDATFFSVQPENACEQKNPSAIQHAHLMIAVFFVFCLFLLSLCESYRRWFRNVTHKESLANRFNRRKSVFAESYDPEGDDDEGEKVCTVCLFFNFVSYRKFFSLWSFIAIESLRNIRISPTLSYSTVLWALRATHQTCMFHEIPLKYYVSLFFPIS